MFLLESMLAMKPVFYEAKKIVYNKNDFPNNLFIIAKGRINCMYNKEMVFKTYVEKSYFGDIEII
jgi:hypothetical protein